MLIQESKSHTQKLESSPDTVLKIRQALISVYDKSKIADLGSFLDRHQVKILSTGGTAELLQSQHIPVHRIEDYIDFPEILNGRVKTLHPKIHGGLLARFSDIQEIEAIGIEPIDLLIVNLYPFHENLQYPEQNLKKAIEKIDIGGPTMLRAAAKNFEAKAVLCDISDYEALMQEIADFGGIRLETRLRLASKVFSQTAAYDSMIANYLHQHQYQNGGTERFPKLMTLSYARQQSLRYGENPHQEAAFYQPYLKSLSKNDTKIGAQNLNWKKLQGKELSYNNILDAEASLNILSDLPRDGVAIIKHNNPCGVALVSEGNTSDHAFHQAFLLARACDPVSAFGAVIGVRGEVGAHLAAAINENFAELVLAQSFSPEALKIFQTKKKLRLIVYTPAVSAPQICTQRNALGGLLYQEKDRIQNLAQDWEICTQKKPSESTLSALYFAWTVCKQVASNAIVFCSDQATLGIGAGQMSRVDSVHLAMSKARKAKLSLKDSVLASDAFFPFRDSIDQIASNPNEIPRAIIQPGGSVRDKEVIQAANEHGLIMLFTNERHFLH